jgi:FADH2 O2-dependent halogenase
MNELTFVQEQFQIAKPTMPLVTTSRVQRRAIKMVGNSWAMLPHAAAFLDPLHSAGNAHTLCGIQRLMPILALPKNEQTKQLRLYETTTMHEVDVLDKIIHGCYQCFDDFELLSNYAMLYFAGADFTERQRRVGNTAGFLNSGDPKFCAMVDSFYNQVIDGTIKPSDISKAIEPWNLVGLCDPAKQNMYDYA